MNREVGEKIYTGRYGGDDKQGNVRGFVIFEMQSRFTNLRVDRLGGSGQFLNIAIGNHKKELYCFDPDHREILVFKYEGPTPQNQ